MSEKMEAAKAAAKEGLRWFYNPVNQPVNAYAVFWVVITLLAFAIIGVSVGAIAIEDNAKLLKAVAGMAGGIAFLAVLGIAFRVMYKDDWENLMQIDVNKLATTFQLPAVQKVTAELAGQTEKTAAETVAAVGAPAALAPPPAK